VNPVLAVAARMLCYVNGRLVGHVVGMDFSSGTPHQELGGLDRGDPFELAPTQTRAEGSFTLLRVVGTGGAQGLGFAPQYEDLVRQKYNTIQIVDRLTKLQLFYASGVSATMERWQVAAKGMMIGTLTYKMLSWENEASRGSGH
jgi:hypothetical protein